VWSNSARAHKINGNKNRRQRIISKNNGRDSTDTRFEKPTLSLCSSRFSRKSRTMPKRKAVTRPKFKFLNASIASAHGLIASMFTVIASFLTVIASILTAIASILTVIASFLKIYPRVRACFTTIASAHVLHPGGGMSVVHFQIRRFLLLNVVL